MPRKKNDTRVTVRLGSLYPLVVADSATSSLSEVIVGILERHYKVEREEAPRGLAAVPASRRARVARKAQKASLKVRRENSENKLE